MASVKEVVIFLCVIAVLLPQFYAENVASPGPAPRPNNHGVGINKNINGYIFMMVPLLLSYLLHPLKGLF
eukprot:Gb_00994 [translate_table: standard]